MHAHDPVLPVCNGCLVTYGSASFLVLNLTLLLVVLGVKFVAELTYSTCTFLLPQHKNPLVCSLPSAVVPSPVLDHVSISSSRYKQRRRSSLHDTHSLGRHPGLCVKGRLCFDARLCFNAHLCFNGPRSHFDGPRSHFDGPCLCFDRPCLCFDGPRQSFDSPHSWFHSSHLCFEGPHLRSCRSLWHFTSRMTVTLCCGCVYLVLIQTRD